MKKIFMTIALLFVCILSFGQIQTLSAKEAKQTVFQYDSTLNFICTDTIYNSEIRDRYIFSYIGQELYVKPKAESLHKYGYHDFYELSINKYGYSSYLYNNEDGYNKIVNKVFIIDSIARVNTYGDEYWFYLTLKDNSEIKCKYKYNGKYKHNWPFITMSYYNYLKSLIGNEYVIKNNMCWKLILIQVIVLNLQIRIIQSGK